MPNRSDLDARYAAAQAGTKEAEVLLDAAIAKDSAALLRKLNRQSVDRRFQALADPDLKLTAADRRDLVRSIRGSDLSKQAQSVATATGWEILRSRLRYRLFSTSVTACAAIAAVVLIGVAHHRTPIQWVSIAATQSFLVQRTFPSGEVVSYPVSPGARYAAIQLADNLVQLRDWEPAGC